MIFLYLVVTFVLNRSIRELSSYQNKVAIRFLIAPILPLN